VQELLRNHLFFNLGAGNAGFFAYRRFLNSHVHVRACARANIIIM
jgi:hypothetical protein